MYFSHSIGEYSAKKIFFPRWIKKFPSIFHFQLTKFSLYLENFFKISTFLGNNYQNLQFIEEKFDKTCTFFGKNLQFWGVTSTKISTVWDKIFTHSYFFPPPPLVFGRIFTYEANERRHT